MTLVDETSSRAHLDSARVRMLVTVQDVTSRQYRPVGFLERDSEGVHFAYLRRAVEQDDFQPLTGLHRAVHGAMVSDGLFPVFAERVIPTGRPDRSRALAALDLPDDAEPFEILERTHGLRVGDTIELLPAPFARPAERVSFTFWVHGVRYLPPEGVLALNELEPGNEVRLRAQPSNPVNPEAVQVLESGGIVVGWVPDPLIRVISRLEQLRVDVVRSNSAELGFHFRLLVRVRGLVDENGDLFDTAEWATV